MAVVLYSTLITPKNHWRTAEEPYRSLTGSVYGSSAKELVKNRWRTTEAPRFGAIQHQKWFPYDYEPKNHF